MCLHCVSAVRTDKGVSPVLQVCSCVWLIQVCCAVWGHCDQCSVSRLVSASVAATTAPIHQQHTHTYSWPATLLDNSTVCQMLSKALSDCCMSSGCVQLLSSDHYMLFSWQLGYQQQQQQCSWTGLGTANSLRLGLYGACWSARYCKTQHARSRSWVPLQEVKCLSGAVGSFPNSSLATMKWLLHFSFFCSR